MGEDTLHIINTVDLFDKLNEKRTSEHHDKIEYYLIASKLGILFALNSTSYINFKSEFVELTEVQLQTLADICTEHFNADISAEIQAMVMTHAEMEATIAAYIPKPKERRHIGLLNKLRGFLFKFREIFLKKASATA